MKALYLLFLLPFAGPALHAQPLDTADLRRIEQRRIFGQGYYRDEHGSPGYCRGAFELSFICASENKKDSAFYFLKESISYTGSNSEVLRDIYDPFDIGSYPFMKWKNSKEWKDYEKKIKENFLKLNGGLKEPKLAYDLLVAFGLDQQIRLYLTKIRQDKAAKQDARRIDSATLVFIKQVVKKYGFPGINMVGKDAYEGAFILCQHADNDLAFQKGILKDLERLVRTGDAKKEDVAYLTDRIMVKEKGVQLYGTQFNNWKLYPIIDSANVDKRRAEMGLGTLAEYMQGFGAYKPKDIH